MGFYFKHTLDSMGCASGESPEKIRSERSGWAGQVGLVLCIGHIVW